MLSAAEISQEGIVLKEALKFVGTNAGTKWVEKQMAIKVGVGECFVVPMGMLPVTVYYGEGQENNSEKRWASIWVHSFFDK